MDVLAVVGVDDRPSAFASLGGTPVLVRSVRTLLAAGMVEHVTVLAPAPRVEQAVALCAELPVAVRTVLGAAPDVEVVLVHDAVRPLAPARLAVAVVDAVRRGHPAAIPALGLTDTVKRLDAGGHLHGGLDRDGLRIVQTPVAVRAELLGRLGPVGPGAAAAVMRAGMPVHTVAGHPTALPVRTSAELELAEAMLAGMIG